MELIFDTKGVKVYCFDLPVGGLNDEEIKIHLESLPPLMQQRISAYKDRLDRQLRIMGKLMLQQLIKDFGLDKHLDLSQIQYSKYNQPFFNSDLFFSTSHAGNKVICAASKTKKTGVDIEKVAPRDLNEFINLLSDQELVKIQKNPDPLMEFYKCWTKKEALSKAMGIGVNNDFMDGSNSQKKNLAKEKSYLFYELAVSTDYVAMLVMEH